MITGKTAESFQQYVDMCTNVGFELFDVRSLLNEAPRNSYLATTIQSSTFLVYFRKPWTEQVARLRLTSEDASSILKATEQGTPVWYKGLAQLVANELDDEDLADLVPTNHRGTKLEKLMEVLAEHDPRDFLEQCFGKAGIRRLAEREGLYPVEEQNRSPLDCILSSFGFAVSTSSSAIEGPSQARSKLRRLAHKIKQAAEKTDVYGPFLDGIKALERLLRISIWGWARLIFGEDRDEQLLSILQSSNPERSYKLDRLTFGHIEVLFAGLPDAIASSDSSDLILEKFRRQHVYLPRNKKTKFSIRLNGIVALRNKIEHNTDGYCDDISLKDLADVTSKVLQEASDLIGELVECHAIPQVGEPFEEIRDKFNRKSYRLTLDNGDDILVRFSTPLDLGEAYLYYGTETNPRPVDPLVLRAADIGDVP
jgi:hypothetical protein